MMSYREKHKVEVDLFVMLKHFGPDNPDLVV